LGFPTGQSFTSLITCQQALWHYTSLHHQQVFLAPLPRNEEEEAPTSTMHQQNIKTPRERYDEHNSKFSHSMKPRFNQPVGGTNHFRRLLLADFGKAPENSLVHG
jgi:hypothetical protein